MKVALVHDYIKEYGGAERVLEELHEIFPDAPIFTSVYLPNFLGPHRERFESWDIRTSWAQYLPFKSKLISPLRLISPFLFRSFDLSKFDVVIVSATGAYFPNSIRTKNHKPSAIRNKPVHICYSHTPPRYLYGYATAREWRKNKVANIIGTLMNHFLRIVDYNSSKNVDQFIANSEEVAGRIKKFYRRDAVVVYPPVDTAASKLAPSVQLENKKLNANQLDARRYYLTGGRLARAKHNEIPVKACVELGVPLKVFGKGFAGYEEELRSIVEEQDFSRHSGEHSDSRISQKEMDSGQARMTEPLIEFLGEVSDEEKLELMAGARAFLYASEDEDFGIIPVEAMAVGTPVIAYRSGGVKETVIDGKTGVFYDELTAESMERAIKRFEQLKIREEDCTKQAGKFSEEAFRKNIKKVIVSVSSL